MATALYQWTGKLGGKTVTVALSQEQYVAFKEANPPWRQAQGILKQLAVLSRQFLFSNYSIRCAVSHSSRKS